MTFEILDKFLTFLTIVVTHSGWTHKDDMGVMFDMFLTFMIVVILVFFLYLYNFCNIKHVSYICEVVTMYMFIKVVLKLDIFHTIFSSQKNF